MHGRVHHFAGIRDWGGVNLDELIRLRI